MSLRIHFVRSTLVNPDCCFYFKINLSVAGRWPAANGENSADIGIASTLCSARMPSLCTLHAWHVAGHTAEERTAKILVIFIHMYMLGHGGEVTEHEILWLVRTS